jgi:hypothetical protein
MNIDNYINHWKNMILKESQDYDKITEVVSLNETEIISEESKPSVLDIKKLIKKVNTDEEYNDLYSPPHIQSSMDKKYEALS